MRKNFDEIIASIKQQELKKIVVAAAQDEHVLEAIKEARKRGIATAILVGDEEKIREIAYLNQKYIEEFELEGYDNLTTLRIEDAINIPVEDIMLNAPNLNRIRLIDVQWEAESESALVQTIEKFKSCLGLDENDNNTNNAKQRKD